MLGTYLAKLTPSKYLGPHKVSAWWSGSVAAVTASTATVFSNTNDDDDDDDDDNNNNNNNHDHDDSNTYANYRNCIFHSGVKFKSSGRWRNTWCKD